jgi:hypothetical protein
MKIKLCLSIFCSLFLCFNTANAVEPLPDNLISLSAKSGMGLLKRDLSENTLKLLDQFTTQESVTYCGVASAVMVLNAININPPVATKYQPYRYYTQEDFFTEKVQKIISQYEVAKAGITLAQLGQIIETFGLKTKTYYANELNERSFRKILKMALANQQFVIVNFLRTGLHEKGGGHHSPLAAYDERTDRFLLLDVARYKYPAIWVSTTDLWNAVYTLDGQTYRGFVVIKK